MLNAARGVLDVEELVHGVHVDLFEVLYALVVLGVLFRHGAVSAHLFLVAFNQALGAVIGVLIPMVVASLGHADFWFWGHGFLSEIKRAPEGALR